ncbi:mitogen-activated protein kinase kinase kinase 14-like, partial [Silurus asotus]
QRYFNSTLPFSMSINQPKVKVQGCLASNLEPILSLSSGKDDKQPDFKNYISKVISYGTAKHIDTVPLGTEKPSIIAQAECESQDSQEFCPNSRATLPIPKGSICQRQPRKKRRKRQRRRVSQKEGQQRDGGNDRVGERGTTRVPQQDSGEVKWALFSSNSSSAVSRESLSVQETAEPCFSYSGLINHPLSCTSWDDVFPSTLDQASYGQEGGRSLETDSPINSETKCSLALVGLRKNVSQAELSFAPPFAKQMVQDVNDKEEEEEEDEENGVEESDINEGILCKEELKPRDYEYREGIDYELCDYLKQGTFGVVYSIRDKSSGFVCAAKKVPLERFRSEEVGSWSALQFPHVVEFFGFVREGRSVILFMDLKTDSLGQLLSERGRLPEDLSLHYMHQVLGALEHLHKRHVIHFDVKVDNVLLSEDGKNTFLCDFGESEHLDLSGFSPFQALKGTETHMAPEVARGEKRCAKVDVWSSCCMLLHMLSGCQPWMRYYSRPLYLKIAEEPPPLREIPPDCSTHTADVIKRGLQREPSQRASAKDLRVQTAKALKQMGGLRSPARGGAYEKPIEKPERQAPSPVSKSSVQQWMGPGHERRKRAGPKTKPKCNTQHVEKVDDAKEANVREEEIVLRKDSYLAPTSPVYFPSPPHESHKPTEQELRKLEREFFLSSLSQPHSAEKQEELLSCLGSDCLSNREPGDKKDSGRWSVGTGDDLSSGVFSYNSQSDGQSFSMDWLGPAHQPPPRCFEGVDVCIRDFNGRCLRIRETPRVKVGHIAIGISDQISESVFSLQSEDGSLVAHDKQVKEAGLFLRCVPAPDPAHISRDRKGLGRNLPWSWRIRDGKLETWD